MARKQQSLQLACGPIPSEPYTCIVCLVTFYTAADPHSSQLHQDLHFPASCSGAECRQKRISLLGVSPALVLSSFMTYNSSEHVWLVCTIILDRLFVPLLLTSHLQTESFAGVRREGRSRPFKGRVIWHHLLRSPPTPRKSPQHSVAKLHSSFLRNTLILLMNSTSWPNVSISGFSHFSFSWS